MEVVENHFKQGIKDGIPIGLGYLSVSFTFGMMAVSQGVPIWVAVAISLTNVTSAGQFSGLSLMVAQGSYLELALSQLIINLRYALMSLSLTQKVDKKMTTAQRAMVSYGVTDEIFALASSTYERVSKNYMFGLIVLPVACWVMGTLFGGVASTLMPESIRASLGIAIYGMFLAIILPPAKKLHSIRVILVISIGLSCTFTLLQDVLPISSGFVIIICTLVASAFGAYFFPVKEVSHDE